MHGVIHQELERFATDAFGRGAWSRIVRRAGLEHRTYVPTERYEDAELTALVIAAAGDTGLGPQRVLEMFGAAIVPTLVDAYGALVSPEWRTAELVLNTEAIIHTALRASGEGVRPPLLVTSRRGANEVVVIYASERQMCGFAKGIVRGIASHYGESVEIADEACMLRGDATCRLVVRVA